MRKAKGSADRCQGWEAVRRRLHRKVDAAVARMSGKAQGGDKPAPHDFTGREALVLAVGRDVAGTLLEESLAEDPELQTIEEAALWRCPRCGTDSPRAKDKQGADRYDAADLQTRVGAVALRVPLFQCPTRGCRKVFPPYRLSVGLDPEDYSPAILEKIVYAGGSHPSYAQATDALAHLADLDLSEPLVRKLTTRAGEELATARDEAVAQYNAKGEVEGRVPNTPQVAAVAVDGGRAQTRAEHAGRGVHQPAWREPHYASLVRLPAPATDADPHPEVPRAFLDEAHVRTLTEEIKSPCSGRRRTPQAARPQPPADAPPSSPSAKPLLQTALASMAPSEAFGTMVAAEAVRRGFDKAPHRAFLGDGQASNWQIQQFHFFDWTPILDFVHLVAYLFSAARAARTKSPTAWTLYVRLVTAAWNGKPDTLISLLTREARRIGPPPHDAPPNDPRHTLADTLRYLRNNADRMHYPTYRRRGLPVTTVAIESLIKRFNFRVKASDKFWTQPGLEAILQVRAALLSQDNRWGNFWANRHHFLAARRRSYHARSA
jgi:hypothetical protein